jgi:hypothetical protein
MLRVNADPAARTSRLGLPFAELGFYVADPLPNNPLSQKRVVRDQNEDEARVAGKDCGR